MSDQPEQPDQHQLRRAWLESDDGDAYFEDGNLRVPCPDCPCHPQLGPKAVGLVVAEYLRQRGQFASCARCYRPVESCDCNAPRPAGHTCGKSCDCGTDAG